MLEAFARDLRGGTPEQLIRAARRAQGLAFLALAAPGLPLGGLYLLTRPVPVPAGWLGAVVLLAAVISLAALRLAHSAARDPVTPAAQTALNAAMRGATAPAVPFLLGCAFLAQPAALALLWGLAGLAFLAARFLVPGWVRTALERSGRPSGERGTGPRPLA